MKRRIYKRYRTRKKGGQHYHIGRKNYGSKLFREQIKKELYGDPERRESRLKEIKESIKKYPLLKDVKFIDNPAVGQRKIIRVIEKHPDLLKDLRESDILLYESDKNVPLGFTKSEKRIVGINKKILNKEILGIDPLTKSITIFSPNKVLKHEATHLKSGKILENLGFNKKEEYDPIREHALAELASGYAMHTDIRKEKLPKKTTEEIAFKFISRISQ